MTLALAFFGVEGLPAVYSSFELSYFERAVDFLLSHHHVKDTSKVGVFGQSMGGSLALAMMSCLGEKVGCCVVAGSQFIFSPGKAIAAELKSSFLRKTKILHGLFNYTPQDPATTGEIWLWLPPRGTWSTTMRIPSASEPALRRF